MIEYRKANINDIDDLVRMRLMFLKEAQNVTNTELDDYVMKSLKDYFSNNIFNDNFISWIACENNKIIATSGLCFYTMPCSYKHLTGKTAYIMNMFTLPKYRKAGIAIKLFELVVKEAKDLGYKKIQLHASEMGRNLYKKFGFEEVNDEMVLKID
jgi:predicted acetyltransferase